MRIGCGLSSLLGEVTDDGGVGLYVCPRKVSAQAFGKRSCAGLRLLRERIKERKPRFRDAPEEI